MNPEDIGRILDEIGERIGPAGEYAWQLAIRWQITYGAVWLVASVIGMAATVIAFRWTWRRAEGASSYDEGPIKVLSAAMAAVVTFIFGVTIVESVLRLTNPEWKAIEALIGAIR